MEVVAHVKLKYNNGTPYTTEGLMAKIRVREKGRLLKTNLDSWIVCEDYYESYSNYLEALEDLTQDKKKIIEMIKNIILVHYTQRGYVNENRRRLSDVKDRIRNMDISEVEVKID